MKYEELSNEIIEAVGGKTKYCFFTTLYDKIEIYLER